VASRAELLQAPRAPRIGGVIRAALSDFYFNSGPLVGANVVWGVAVVGVSFAWLASPLLALLLSPFLAFPTVGVFRVAGRIVRKDGHISISDALAAFRDYSRPTLLLGLALVAGGLVLGTNAIVGLSGSEPAGWFVGTIASWSLIVLWCAAIVAWPLLVDPVRTDRSLGTRLRLVGLLLLANPGRLALLGFVVAAIATVSTILLAAILTISLSFIALIACRYVYAVADRVEARSLGPGE
jgi:uncharacterized membrane protein YesL